MKAVFSYGQHGCKVAVVQRGRRYWATERKHLPLPDVAAAGGWTGPETLQRIYQQPDAETMYRVVSEPSKLKEAR